MNFHENFIKTSFNFKIPIAKCSITDTSCAEYPMTTKKNINRDTIIIIIVSLV